MYYEMFDDACLQTNTDVKIKERMTYLFYELRRKGSLADYRKLSLDLGDVLSLIKKNMQKFPAKKNHNAEYLLYLFKLIVQTRDIYQGKGERDVTYMQIHTWYDHFPILAINAVPLLVQFGCWRDICGICEYVQENSPLGHNHPLIESCIEIMIRQLMEDVSQLGERKPISLAAKWVPREKRTNQWLFDAFVLQWTQKNYPYMLKSPKHSCGRDSAWNKCRMKFRKIISCLTKELNLIESKQCSQSWSTIGLRDVNLGTFISQKDCLLNVRKGKERTHKNIEKGGDRQQCSQHLQKIYQNDFPKCAGRPLTHRRASSGNGLHSISPGYFVKRAIQLLYKDEENSTYIQNEILLLNKQWIKYMRTCANLPAVLPIIDMNSSGCHPVDFSDDMCNAIGLTCIIAEKSLIHMRAMATHSSGWINLEMCVDFISMVKTICESYVATNDSCELVDSLLKLTVSFCQSKMTNESVSQIVFVIFTDSSQYVPRRNPELYFHDRVLKEFYGYSPPPHVVYWNLSNSVPDTTISPSCGTIGGTTVISGNSPALLNHLQFLGLSSVRTLTPFNALCNILDSDRYDPVEEIFMKFIE
jgi:hypothetical protein